MNSAADGVWVDGAPYIARFVPAKFQPVYSPIECGPWKYRIARDALSSGYWGQAFIVSDLAVLLRRAGDDYETWMSITPFEIESQELGCRFARGRTAVMGLGMGWAAGEAAMNPDVVSVDVVERDPDVIRAIAAQDIFAQLPPEARGKVRVHHADALEWRPETPIDTLLADIWLPLNGDERVEEVRRMRANTGASRVYFWGQEMVIARRARDTGRTLDTDTVAAIVAEIGLPLIGPEDLADYPERIATAARRRLKD